MEEALFSSVSSIARADSDLIDTFSPVDNFNEWLLSWINYEPFDEYNLDLNESKV